MAYWPFKQKGRLMPSSMQSGKRYRLRANNDRRFVDGYFLDNHVYDDLGTHLGNIEPDGLFRYVPSHGLHQSMGGVHRLRIAQRNSKFLNLIEVEEEE
jgi:hypothetical protein